MCSVEETKRVFIIHLFAAVKVIDLDMKSIAASPAMRACISNI